MTGFADWLVAFRRLHAQARAGRLEAHDREVYRAGRDDLARALIAAQHLTLRPGETPRRALRVACALQADLDLVTSRLRAVTLDVSTGGISCLLGKAPPAGDEVGFSLRLPGAASLAGRARVVEAKALAGNVRVSFEFLSLTEAEIEQLELFVFDTVLQQLAG
jgi:hypothetical protein